MVQIGLDARVLDGEHPPRAPEAGLDFVGDQQNAVGIADASQLGEQLRRRDVESAFALHGLDDHGSHVARLHVPAHHQIEGAQAILHAYVPMSRREGHAKNPREPGVQAAFVRHRSAGEGHAEAGAAVKGAAEGDDRRPAGRDTRDLHCRLDRLYARRQQQALRRTLERRDRIEPLGQADVGLVRHHLEGGMRKALELRADCRDHFGVPMSRGQHADAAGEIHITAADTVPHLGILGAHGEFGRSTGDAARHGRGPASIELSGVLGFHDPLG